MKALFILAALAIGLAACTQYQASPLKAPAKPKPHYFAGNVTQERDGI